VRGPLLAVAFVAAAALALAGVTSCWSSSASAPHGPRRRAEPAGGGHAWGARVGDAGPRAAAAAAAGGGVALGTMTLVFLKIGAVLYGSGYVLLAFLRADFVERLGWLTDRQLLDAVAWGR